MSSGVAGSGAGAAGASSRLRRLICLTIMKMMKARMMKFTATVMKLLSALDALRRPARLETFLAACWADKRGRLGHVEDDYPPADYLRRACATAASVQAAPFIADGLTGPAVGAAMEAARVKAIANVKLASI